MKAIVIYDDKCPVCTAFGTFGRNITPIGYNTKQAKKLMVAQFGKDYGFALMIFTPNKVSWGGEAAAEITKTAYNSFIGKNFKSLIYLVYPLVAGILNITLRRRTPEPPKFKGKRLPEKGNLPLTNKARAEFKKTVALQSKKAKQN